MRRTVISCAALSAVFFFGGCATFGTMQTASTIGQGKTRIALEPSMWGAAGGGQSALLPNFAVSMRYGVSDRVDIGGRIGVPAPGFELTSKFLVTSPKSKTLAVSIAPSAGGFVLAAGSGGSGTGGIVFVQVPVLIGIKLGTSELVIAPKIHDLNIFGIATSSSASGSGSGSFNLFSIGASVGFSFGLGKTFKIMPEVAFVKPVVASAQLASGNDQVSQVFDTNGALLQIGVALMFGG